MERIPYIVPMQRSRTTVEGTKPQCQPIDLRCSLRGPLLRREKNKLIERRGGERERGNEGGKERRGEGRMEGRRGSAGWEKKRLEKENISSVERALLEEESAKEKNERDTKERADQRAAWWEMQSRMRPLCAQRKGRLLPRSRSCVTFARLIATSITTTRWFTSDRRNERRQDFGWITANSRNKALSFFLSPDLAHWRLSPEDLYSKIPSVCYFPECACREIFFSYERLLNTPKICLLSFNCLYI